MTPQNIDQTMRRLPWRVSFNYYSGREGPWMLANLMAKHQKVSVLKSGPLARFLDRPLVQPVVAMSGGTLKRADLVVAADPERAMEGQLSKAARAGASAAFAQPWFDLELTFGAWICDPEYFWRAQMSRRGGNLVLQISFPSDFDDLNEAWGMTDAVSEYQCYDHPVSEYGRYTMAWVRLDIEGRVALIEEVQCDWIKIAANLAVSPKRLAAGGRVSQRNLRNYAREVRRRYDKVWPKAAMLAALMVLRDGLGVEEVFMHQPDTGIQLKYMKGMRAPISLYTQLPRSFGFVPTSLYPQFLKSTRRGTLGRIGRGGRPVFWYLPLRRTKRGL